MKPLVFALLFGASRLLQGSSDPLLGRLNAPLPAGTWGLEAGVREFTRDYWLDSEGKTATQGGYAVMADADGVSKSVKGFEFDFKLLWAAGKRNLLEVSLPYFNQEFSRAVAFQFQPNNLDDATVRRADASGDLAFAWRGLVLGEPDGPYKAGLRAELSIPTGQGPFASAHPLVATGNGGFVAAGALVLEAGQGAWRGWAQARAPYEFGNSADIAPGAFIGYRKERPPLTLPGGRAWVSRAPSYSLCAGLAWEWFQGEAARHTLSLELQSEQRGSLLLDGAEVANTSSTLVSIVPQARFAFGKALALNFGWITPAGYASGQAVAYWGEFLIRVDTAL
jgi:hypothetical protein